MKLFFVGPSHIPRLRHALETVRLPRITDEIVYLGDGGYPLWNKSVFQHASENFQPGDLVVLIVADFRFGNGVLNEVSPTEEKDTFLDGYTHVDRNMCTSEHDAMMKKRCLHALSRWRDRFGDSIVIFHWTLAMRTVRNRMLKIHVAPDGMYTHPTWNINDPGLLGNVEFLPDIQTTSELDICNAMMIDNDLHPSTLGYLYINGIATYRDHNRAISSARSIYMAGFNALVSKIQRSGAKGTLICGDSTVLHAIKRSIPLGTLRDLLSCGVEIRPDYNASEPSGDADEYERVIFVSKELRVTDGESPDQTPPPCGSNAQRPQISLHWDSIAKQVMQWRARNQRNMPTGLLEVSHAKELWGRFMPADKEFSFTTIDRLIEHGAGGAPTIWALFLILSRGSGALVAQDIAHSAMESMRVMAKSQYRM